LLLKKFNSGKFTVEDHQALQETLKSQNSPQESLKPNQYPSSGSFFANPNSSVIQQNLPAGLSQASSRNNSREPSKTDRPLPQLNPQLNVQDITYTFKDKASTGSAPHKNMASNQTQVIPTSMFGSTVSSTRNPPADATLSFQPNLARDPRNEFKRVPSSGGNSKPIQNHSVLLYPPSYNSIKSSAHNPSSMVSSHLKGNASKSFDMDSNRYPVAMQNPGSSNNQQALLSQTSRKFKTPQAVDYTSMGKNENNHNFKRGSSAGHQDIPAIPSSILSPSHALSSGQYQAEPKSRKLLEMMLKKITKVGSNEMEPERRTSYATTTTNHQQIASASSKSRPSHEVLKPQFLDMKSLSLEPSNTNNKKKLIVTNHAKNSGHDSSHNSRRSSKDSVYNQQVPQPVNYLAQQTPTSQTHGQSVLKANAFVTPGINTVAHHPGSGYGNVISLNKSKLIQIRNVKMRSPLVPMAGGGGHYNTHGAEIETFQGGHNHSYDYPLTSQVRKP
jgi:hypothetical protein